MAGNTVVLNGNSLQTANYMTSDTDDHTPPQLSAAITEMAHTNASALPYASWPKRIVNIKGRIVSTTTLAALDSLEDTFRGYLAVTNVNLDIGKANGTTRRYNVLGVTKSAMTRPNELNVLSYDIEFTCQPFGLDTGATTLINLTGQTTASLTMTPTFSGSAPYQYPVFTVTMTTVGGSPVVGTVSIGNNTNGQQINVTRTWTNGDVLVIDPTQMLTTTGVSLPVTVNSLPVTFSGAFPLFTPGSSSISYTDTFASRTMNITIANTTRWM